MLVLPRRAGLDAGEGVPGRWVDVVVWATVAPAITLYRGAGLTRQGHQARAMAR
jgi:hypothetical protein